MSAVEKKPEDLVTDQLWEFNFHKGQQFLGGHVRASSEALALLVAQRFCAVKGYRPPAAVRPFILADESILGVSVEAEAMPIPSAVAATTNENEGGLRNTMNKILGR